MAYRYPLDKFTISQGFGGNAAYYKQFGYGGHNGIDLAAAAGTPVYAADEGTIIFEGWGQNHSWMLSPAGICIIINHGGSYAGYAHLSSTVVNKNQKVTKGQLIGYVGSTGAATGPHLHFEMLPLSPNFKNGFAGRIDPTPYIEISNKATEAQIKQAYRDILERDADQAGINHYKNYTIEFVRNDLAQSQEKRNLETAKAAAALAEAQRKEAEAKKKAEEKAAAEAAAKAQAEIDRIKAEEEAAKLAAEEKANSMEAIIKQNNSLLKEILGFLKSIFKIGGQS